MAAPRKTGEPSRTEPTISRTYRAAIRIGEDFVTLEETITLPIDATDDEVSQAVDLGWRIYRAQRAAVEEQVVGVREAQPAPQTPIVRDPDAPASEKQRHYITVLQEDLTWSNEQLAAYASEQHVDLVTMTKGQASTFIDGLKKLAEERPAYQASNRAPTRSDDSATPARQAADAGPANKKQLAALEQLAHKHGLDLGAEVRRRFDSAIGELTGAQASALLTEWQQRPARRTVNEPVL